MDTRILLAADLDRTLMPNGFSPESPKARPRLKTLMNQPDVTLVYVSGRNLRLMQEAMAEFGLSPPVYAIGNIGTSIFKVDQDVWEPVLEWEEHMTASWKGVTQERLQLLFQDLNMLQLQEGENQTMFRLSYYGPADTDAPALIQIMEQRLKTEGIEASFVWSIDELHGHGMLDILPPRSTKGDALAWLREKLGFTAEQTLFAGDSGNDLTALTSGVNAVLVANAHEDIRTQAIAMAAARSVSDRLYLAEGNFMGMNGNYSAGILEGAAHFFPFVKEWLKE